MRACPRRCGAGPPTPGWLDVCDGVTEQWRLVHLGDLGDHCVTVRGCTTAGSASPAAAAPPPRLLPHVRWLPRPSLLAHVGWLWNFEFYGLLVGPDAMPWPPSSEDQL